MPDYFEILKFWEEPSSEKFDCWFYDITTPCYKKELKMVPDPLKEYIEYPKYKSLISKYLYLLYKLGQNSKDILELGVLEGVSTTAFSLGLKESGGKMVSVDLEILPQAKNKIEAIGANKIVTFWKENDLKFKAKPESYDLVFIDTTHSFGQTKKELKKFSKCVKPGGLLVLHDLINHHYKNDKELLKAVEDGLHCSKMPIPILRDDFEKSPVYLSIQSFLRVFWRQEKYRLFKNFDCRGLAIIEKLKS